MLRELHIQDFAIIDELQLVLEPGLNILTGETGAGKSILLDAVALLLGGRADTTTLREGAERARVEGQFILSAEEVETLSPLLAREGLEGDAPDVLWLGRELRSNGRNLARINGRVVALSVLREIAEGLVDIHGQSEHLSLLRVQEHLNLVDRFAGLQALRDEVAGSVKQINAVRRDLRQLRQSERDRMQRIDLLRFQVQEIRSAKPTPGEIEGLERELVRLNHAQELAALTSNLIGMLEDGQEQIPSVIDLLGQSQRELLALARIDATFASHAEAVESLGYQIEDLARTLRDYFRDIEFNPKRQVEVEERLILLRHLERKYGGDLEEVRAYAKQAAAELDMLERSDEHIEELARQEADLLQVVAALSIKLSEERRRAAAALSQGVEAELQDLRMEGARFGVAFRWRSAETGVPLSEPKPLSVVVDRHGVQAETPETAAQVDFDTTGIDEVEFLIAPNVGEGLKPMTRIASGGETARLMLALKAVLSRADRTPTLIFDEIDQGIGGRVGGVVGHKLWQLTQGKPMGSLGRHQVLCVTHLPQLAGFGDAHYRVTKHVAEGRTLTKVDHLTPDERVMELAQMLGTQGQAAVQGALEILAQAKALQSQG